MANYIETKVRYEKMHDNGKVKKVTEPYMVDALSFTEAEARITEKMKAYISGDYSVSAAKKSNISEIFWDAAGDKFYRVKVNFITIDGKTLTEKKTATHILVQAADLDCALYNFKEGMKGTMADYEIASISETAIMDVFTYKAKDNDDVAQHNLNKLISAP